MSIDRVYLRFLQLDVPRMKRGMSKIGSESGNFARISSMLVENSDTEIEKAHGLAAAQISLISNADIEQIPFDISFKVTDATIKRVHDYVSEARKLGSRKTRLAAPSAKKILSASPKNRGEALKTCFALMTVDLNDHLNTYAWPTPAATLFHELAARDCELREHELIYCLKEFARKKWEVHDYSVGDLLARYVGREGWSKKLWSQAYKVLDRFHQQDHDAMEFERKETLDLDRLLFLRQDVDPTIEPVVLRSLGLESGEPWTKELGKHFKKWDSDTQSKFVQLLDYLRSTTGKSPSKKWLAGLAALCEMQNQKVLTQGLAPVINKIGRKGRPGWSRAGEYRDPLPANCAHDETIDVLHGLVLSCSVFRESSMITALEGASERTGDERIWKACMIAISHQKLGRKTLSRLVKEQTSKSRIKHLEKVLSS